jgi:hypothetical protein
MCHIIKNHTTTAQHIILDAVLQIAFSADIIIAHLTLWCDPEVKKSHLDYHTHFSRDPKLTMIC